jgi:hypothetical protein
MMTKLIHFMLTLFRKKHNPTQDTTLILDSINQLKTLLLAEVQDIKQDIQDIKLNVDLLEKRLSFKELKDKQQWGHLQYKLNEVRPSQSEQEKLRRQLDENLIKNNKKIV